MSNISATVGRVIEQTGRLVVVAKLSDGREAQAYLRLSNKAGYYEPVVTTLMRGYLMQGLHPLGVNIFDFPATDPREIDLLEHVAEVLTAQTFGFTDPIQVIYSSSEPLEVKPTPAAAAADPMLVAMLDYPAVPAHFNRKVLGQLRDVAVLKYEPCYGIEVYLEGDSEAPEETFHQVPQLLQQHLAYVAADCWNLADWLSLITFSAEQFYDALHLAVNDSASSNFSVARPEKSETLPSNLGKYYDLDYLGSSLFGKKLADTCGELGLNIVLHTASGFCSKALQLSMFQESLSEIVFRRESEYLRSLFLLSECLGQDASGKLAWQQPELKRPPTLRYSPLLFAFKHLARNLSFEGTLAGLSSQESINGELVVSVQQAVYLSTTVRSIYPDFVEVFDTLVSEWSGSDMERGQLPLVDVDLSKLTTTFDAALLDLATNTDVMAIVTGLKGHGLVPDYIDTADSYGGYTPKLGRAGLPLQDFIAEMCDLNFVEREPRINSRLSVGDSNVYLYSAGDARLTPEQHHDFAPYFERRLWTTTTDTQPTAKAEVE